jgi:hydrogenase-4 membrane subunit HyfE
MFLELYGVMVEFLESNAVLIALLIATVEYIKSVIKPMSWYKGWIMTVIAFAIGFILAIPAGPIVWLDFIAHGVGLGLVATGLYRTGESLSRK